MADGRVDEGVIDLARYLDERDARGDGKRHFALWGADGERSRFALPLWRIVFLAGGDRGAIVRQGCGGGETLPFVVLDLARDPARIDFPEGGAIGRTDTEPPVISDRGAGGLAVYLGSQEETSWSLLVDGVGHRPPLDARARESVLFLAGECAGLLFLRDLANVSG